MRAVPLLLLPALAGASPCFAAPGEGEEGTVTLDRGYALVVGIDTYGGSKWPRLRYPVRDARAMGDYLASQGFVVRVLLDEQATRRAIVHGLEVEIAPRLGPRDRVLVFFAGHGATETIGGQEYGYIVPADADNSPSSYLSMEELQALSKKMSVAKHQLFIMDACYGGLLATRGGELVQPEHPHYLQELTRRAARQILTAGGKDQQVMDGGPFGHSVFTGYLLQALRDGYGDLNGDGNITFSELYDYLLPTASNAMQSPLAGQLPGHEGGQFVFRFGGGASKEAVMDLVQTETSTNPTRGNDAGWVRIEPGEFWMGAGPEEQDMTTSARHKVKLTRPFLIHKTETTQDEWEAVMTPERNPSAFYSCGGSCPVENISFFDALNYLNELSKKEGREECYEMRECTGETGKRTDALYCKELTFRGLDCKGYRLPTEAEWEYAARAGAEGATHEGTWKRLGARNAPVLDPLAYYAGNSGATYHEARNCGYWEEKQLPSSTCGTHPVASKKPNAWGLYDTLGNVAEWAWDAVRGDYRYRDPTVDPLGVAFSDRRAVRGCGYEDPAHLCRLGARNDNYMGVGYSDIGLRPVRTVR